MEGVFCQRPSMENDSERFTITAIRIASIPYHIEDLSGRKKPAPRVACTRRAE